MSTGISTNPVFAGRPGNEHRTIWRTSALTRPSPASYHPRTARRETRPARRPSTHRQRPRTSRLTSSATPDTLRHSHSHSHAAGTPDVAIVDVTKRFGDVVAVDAMNLSLVLNATGDARTAVLAATS